MENNYKHLNNILKVIKQFNLRLIKENNSRSRGRLFKYVNGIELNDEVINDIIQLIKNESGLNLKDFIKDINLTIKYRNDSHKLFDERMECVRNKKELIQYMRNEHSNYAILSAPIDNLLYWNCTTKGYDFYGPLNEKIVKKLNLYNI